MARPYAAGVIFCCDWHSNACYLSEVALPSHRVYHMKAAVWKFVWLRRLQMTYTRRRRVFTLGPHGSSSRITPLTRSRFLLRLPLQMMQNPKFFGRKKGMTSKAATWHKETGSPFDTTRIAPPSLMPPARTTSAAAAAAATAATSAAAATAPALSIQPGVNVFTATLTIPKPNPHQYLMRHTGTGGSCTAGLKGTNYWQGATTRPPPAMASWPRDNPPNSELRYAYERGDLPVVITQKGVHNTLTFKVDPHTLDLNYYMPLFFSGIREEEQPYAFIAMEGVTQLIAVAGRKAAAIVPRLILPLRDALNTRRPGVINRALAVIKLLATCDVGDGGEPQVAAALVPYFRQLLPVCNLIYNKASVCSLQQRHT